MGKGTDKGKGAKCEGKGKGKDGNGKDGNGKRDGKGKGKINLDRPETRVCHWCKKSSHLKEVCGSWLAGKPKTPGIPATPIGWPWPTPKTRCGVTEANFFLAAAVSVNFCNASGRKSMSTASKKSFGLLPATALLCDLCMSGTTMTGSGFDRMETSSGSSTRRV